VELDRPVTRRACAERDVYAPSRALLTMNWVMLTFFAFVTVEIVREFIQDVITQAGPAAPGKLGRWATAGFAMAAVGIWLLLAAFVSRMTRARLVAEESGLTVINYLHTYSLRWHEIRGFRVAGAYWRIYPSVARPTIRRRTAPRMRCPRVAAFLARYLYSHQVQDRLLPLE
jgi:hypothetical protein